MRFRYQGPEAQPYTISFGKTLDFDGGEYISIGDAKSDLKGIASSIKILAGDFNSTNDEPLLKEIRYFLNPVEKQGMDYHT